VDLGRHFLQRLRHAPTRIGEIAQLITEASSSDPSEAENSRYDQKDSDNVVEKPRHDQNENAGEQGDDRLEMLDADVHGGCSFGVIFGRICGHDRII
jgi:hypothetical protein